MVPLQGLSRQEFLKLSGLAAAAVVFQPSGLFLSSSDQVSARRPSYQLGRATRWMYYYDAPSFNAKQLGFYNTDTVLSISEEVIGQPEKPDLNYLWLRSEDGWVNASYVQPVKKVLNEPILDIPKGGFLAEVTVPITQAWVKKRNELVRTYRFYYGSTHWVDFAIVDEFGAAWYRVYDDREEKYYFALAEHFRPIPPEELNPTSLDVADKRIEIYLAEQVLTAYENGREVFTTLVSTGAGNTETPVGEFRIERKRPSRHMAATEGNGFDLPAVPWVCFISWTGVSIHGTYWHNNFGHTMSHGCINLTPEAAKWIYCWTLPVVPPEQVFLEKSVYGTPVIIYEKYPYT